MKLLLAISVIILLSTSPGVAQDKKADAKDALKEIAGSAEFLRAVPKKFARLQHVNAAKRTITVILDGDKDATTWTLTPDAEVKVRGWWARLDDLLPLRKRADICHLEPRVWMWFKIDRAKKPVAVFMVADDLSEQDIHGDGLKIKSIDEKTIVFTDAHNKPREVPTKDCTPFQDSKPGSVKDLKPGQQVFLSTFGSPTGCRHHLLDRATFETARKHQKDQLRERWLKEGLPGAIGFLHVYSGEVDVLLDHEAIRWGRSLSLGDKVVLLESPPINAVVKSVQAQREKTQVRLVAKTFDLADLQIGQRVQFKMNAPSPEVENSLVPPGIELPKTKEERIDWFLANTYCPCGVGGDGCTGHFYTLASCNPNACGAPNMTRKYIAKKIDDGWTNREIFDALYKQRGAIMLRPHLLP